ncbi:MAG: M81 family metallopeptidase [Beijerinckiaceae bacterium]
MRIFTAALALEANTFIPLPSSYRAFTDKMYFPPGTHPPFATLQSAAVWVTRERGKTDGFTVIEGSSYSAQPGGTATRDAYERMRDEILGQIKAAMPLDGIVLSLHGAMVADGYLDCEGDFLERIRAITGPKVVIGVELDPHCHLTLKRCKLADVIVLYKEYPHTDFVARGHEVVTMVTDMIKGKIKPVKSIWDCRTLGSFPTDRQPMRGLVDKISAMEGKNGVLSISIGHGFAQGDSPECGARILVITDNAKATGDRIAEEIGHELVALRQIIKPKLYKPDEAIDEALSIKGLVVIADTSDNAGGGAPSDNTTFLHRLIARKVKNSAVAPLWDPMAVKLAFDAGVGTRMPFRFGGKTARTSGKPVDAEVEIVSCAPESSQSFAGSPVPLGDVATLRTKEGVSAILISTRAQAMGVDLFSNHGVDPKKQKILVVKSNQHFFAAFAPIAAKVLYATAGGPLTLNPRTLPYRHIQRPIWPLDKGAKGALIM